MQHDLVGDNSSEHFLIFQLLIIFFASAISIPEKIIHWPHADPIFRSNNYLTQNQDFHKRFTLSAF